MNNIGFYILNVYALLILLVLCLIFFKKDRLHKEEDETYGKLLNNCIMTIVAGIVLSITISTSKTPEIILVFINKIYLFGMSMVISIFTFYTYLISNENITEQLPKIKKIFRAIRIISLILIMIAPLELDNMDGIQYCKGMSLNITYLIFGVYFSIIIYLILKNIKNLNKKYIPIILITITSITITSIQVIFPQANYIINPNAVLTCLIMYFTIENPDVKMLEEMKMLKDQADKANNAKSDFLSNMSHEIRTPLNAIVGFSETLKDEEIPDSAREHVDDIIMASNNLLDIVNGILDISKIEANKLEIIDKEYDIKSILDELTALTKARIGDKGLDFRVNIDPSIPRVLYGDNVRIKQVILNILTNAVKYTKEGYVIFTVSSVIKGDICRLIISVEDSGIGIKEESIPKLFSKFERLDVEKEITIEGTGLGLAITKRLVELMHGTIVVQSVYGKGSKFTVSIDQRVISMEPKEVKSSPFTESKIIDAQGARVLVVDDNALNIKVASVLLKKYHFNIDEASSGYECLNKVNKGEKYDIIFLDDMMPKLNGKETLLKLKKIEGFNMPVIALTANAITGMKQEYLNAGFDDYLSKPIEKQELERIIKIYINKKNSVSTNTNYSSQPSSILSKTITFDLPKLVEDKPIEIKTTSPKKKVLLVDDNELNIKVALATLKTLNLDVTSVNSGSSAIANVIDNKYDLILLDEMMPELDGCTTLDNLKTIDGFTTPVIMMTASPEDEVADKIKEHGFNGYLSKPFKKEDLEKIINEILN